MDSIRRESRLEPIASLAKSTPNEVPHLGSEVSETVFVEQEGLYFRTAAQSRGIFYYHALSLLLVPLLAAMTYPAIQYKNWLLALVAMTLCLHLGHLVAFFFAKSLFKNWVLGVVIEATMITLLSVASGGIASVFKYQLFLLIHYAIVRLKRNGAYIAGVVSATAIIALYLFAPATDEFLEQDLALFLAFIVAAAAASGEVSHFIRFAHDRSIKGIIQQVRANRTILEQRSEISTQGARYRQLLETVSAIPWEFDGTSRVFNYIGPRIVHLLGYPIQEWITHVDFFMEVVHEDDRRTVAEILSCGILANKEARDIEFRVLTATGAWKWLLCSASNTMGDGGCLSQGVLFDITQRKESDIELQKYRERLEEIVEERTHALNEYASRLEKLSVEDALTGLHNRRYFEREMDKEWRRALRRREPIAVLMFDVDEFKAYNDRYGHLAGDKCLAAVAHSLKTTLRRAGDFVARYGGEEFVAVIPGADLEESRLLADKMRVAVMALGLEHSGNRAGVVTVSVGYVSAKPAIEIHAEDFIQAADSALFEAKRQGRNCSSPGHVGDKL